MTLDACNIFRYGNTMNGNLLRAFRQSAGLSQQKLAARIGVARETLSHWEGGRRIDIGMLPIVSEITGIAPAKLRPDLANKLWPGELTPR